MKPCLSRAVAYQSYVQEIASTRTRSQRATPKHSQYIIELGQEWNQFAQLRSVPSASLTSDGAPTLDIVDVYIHNTVYHSPVQLSGLYLRTSYTMLHRFLK